MSVIDHASHRPFPGDAQSVLRAARCMERIPGLFPKAGRYILCATAARMDLRPAFSFPRGLTNGPKRRMVTGVLFAESEARC